MATSHLSKLVCFTIFLSMIIVLTTTTRTTKHNSKGPAKKENLQLDIIEDDEIVTECKANVALCPKKAIDEHQKCNRKCKNEGVKRGYCKETTCCCVAKNNPTDQNERDKNENK